MEEYDPLKAPDPQQWLKMDETERLTLVEKYHEKMNVELEDPRMHAIMHVIVENQLAENIPDVVEAMERLQFQKLNRHNAIHAIATVLADFFWELIRRGKSYSDMPAEEAYLKELRKLTKRSWYRKIRKAR